MNQLVAPLLFVLNVGVSPQGVHLRNKLKMLLGIGFCVCAAIVLSLLMNDNSDVQLVAPFICLFAVTMAAFFSGRVAAFLGAIGACVTFCFLLFPPVGSIRVANPIQRIAIMTFMLLAALAVRLAPPAALIEGNDSHMRRPDGPKKH